MPDEIEKIKTPDELIEDAVLLNKLPPGGGVPAVPYVQEFSSLLNALSKTFRNPDQGYRMSREDAKKDAK